MSEHNAEQRVRQYLNTWDGDASYREPIDKLDGRRLLGADLREVLRQLDDARSELELVTAERDSLRKDIDGSIARQAATVAKRAKVLADRAAYLAQFATGGPGPRVVEYPAYDDAVQADTEEAGKP